MAKKRKKSNQSISTATNTAIAVDIDDIFAKRTKVEEKAVEAADGPSPNAPKTANTPAEKVVKTSAKVVETPTNAKKTSSSHQKAPIDDDFANSRGTGKRRTIDGLPLYDINEIVSQSGGDTDQCPFDCQCCY